MKKTFFTLMAVVSAIIGADAQTHSEQFIRNWEFSRDGQSWEHVVVPHDWAISGPFDKKWDLQIVWRKGEVGEERTFWFAAVDR